jgi:transcriptional regulator GlxA family with amidase domain
MTIVKGTGSPLRAIRGSVLAALMLLAPGAGLAAPEPTVPRIRHALFVVVDGVYNSELMAPYDVLQHTRYRDPDDYVETAIVSPDGRPVTTFEGIEVRPHFSFRTAPRPDILVIPSTEGSMSSDLGDSAYMGWVRKAVAEAEWVITVCDGAFPLAATGALDGRVATTFPGDREELRRRFPAVEVREDVRLVVDGKYITSVGGGMSYEPAFYLVQTLYGVEHARATARGLVWPWDFGQVPHLVVERPSH